MVLLISMYYTRIENRENLKILIPSKIKIINLSHINTNQILNYILQAPLPHIVRRVSLCHIFANRFNV